MEDLLRTYENKQAEIVFEWKDSETEAEGWVVINSLRGGAAGGGTRMRKGLDKHEVTSLAKTMEIKFTVSGPPIGGAKSGINFDPRDPRKRGVLERWFKAVSPLLKHYYGTGGDMNVDEVHEVIPITEQYGLWHPQEGVFNGHFQPTEGEKIARIGQLRNGVKKVLESADYSPDVKRKYVVADMITGYGVAQAASHYYDIYENGIQGKRAIIQGFGNVGSAAAFYLAQMGVKIVAIQDLAGGVINERGFTFEEIRSLYRKKVGNTLRSKDMLPAEKMNSLVWDVEADIFARCAAYMLVTKQQVDRLLASGMEVISCGANVPFADSEIFFGPTMEFTDNNLSLIPDFISNCGMARAFAYFMEQKVEMTDENIFKDTSDTIRRALLKTHQLSDKKTQISKRAFEVALKQLV